MPQAASPVGPQALEGWAGEARLNLVRLAALILFYGYHLLNVYEMRQDEELSGPFHISATALVMVWSVGVVLLWLYLSRRWVPPALKYIVTAWDTLLITTLIVLAGGPRSPLVILYFLLIAAAPLRLSLRLVVTATLLALASYAFTLGHYVFYRIGSERYYADPALQIPRSQEVLFALGLVAAGILAGQIVRQAHRLLAGTAASADAGTDARRAEVRQDTRWIAMGLVVVAVLVGLGLLFSATLGPSSLGDYSTLPVLAIIGTVFVLAVIAAIVEARLPGKRLPGTGW